MTRCRPLSGLVVVAAILLGAMATSGCMVVPMKVTTRVEDPGGTRQAPPGKDLSPGQTTRREVEERYKAFAVESDVPGLFWGRFRKSSWGFGGATLLPAPYATGGRMWGVYNILITFDEHDTVSSSAIVGEGDFQAHYARLAAQRGVPPLDVSRELKIEDLAAQRDNGSRANDLELTRTAVVVTSYPYLSAYYRAASRSAPPTVATVPLDRIERVKVGRGGEDARRMEVEIRFTGKTAVGKSVKLLVDPRAGTRILAWLTQARPDLASAAPRTRSGK